VADEGSEQELRTYMVEREVDLAFGRVRELDLVVRPGPFTVVSRLDDGHGRAVRARLRLGDREALTLDDGSFQLAVPHGGLHAVRLAGLDAPGFGWVDLDPRQPENTLLLDADDRRPLVLDLGARVLVVTTVPALVELEGANFGFDPLEPLGSTLARLSPRLAAGRYAWTRATVRIDAEGGVHVDPASRSGVVTVEDGILSVVDAR
jgi:hypothetical protein